MNHQQASLVRWLLALGLLSIGLVACALPNPIPFADGKGGFDAPTPTGVEGGRDHGKRDAKLLKDAAPPPSVDGLCPRTDAKGDGLCRPRDAGSDLVTDGNPRDGLRDVTQPKDVGKLKDVTTSKDVKPGN